MTPHSQQFPPSPFYVIITSSSSLLPDLSVEQFFSSRGSQESPFGRLTRALAELLQTQPENVQIFSVGGAGRPGEESLNMWFAAHGSPYYKAEKLLGYVAANKAKVSVVF